MRGSGNVRFSDLFADTMRTHGLVFCWFYYILKHDMPEWEFEFWLVASQPKGGY